MSILSFNGPQLGQKIRMVLRTLPAESVIVVAESHADTSALSALLSDGVNVQRGNGKANCVGAHTYLTQDERKRALFLVDCDGEDNRSILAKRSLIVSEHRDLESDMFFRLRSFEELVVRHLAENDGSLLEYRLKAKSCQKFVLTLATTVGIIRDLANRNGLQTRLEDSETAKRRKFGIRDIVGIDVLCRELKQVSIADAIDIFGSKLNWSVEECNKILQDSAANADKRCRMHSLTNCCDCKARRFANGHELVDIGARVLAYHVRGVDSGVKPDFRGFEALLRASTTGEKCSSWPTVERIQRFESWSGLSVLKEPHVTLPAFSSAS